MQDYSQMSIAELEQAIIAHEMEAQAARRNQQAAHDAAEAKRRALPMLAQGQVMQPGDDWGSFFKSLPPAAIEAFKLLTGGKE